MTIYNSPLVNTPRGDAPTAFHGDRNDVQSMAATVTCAAAPATTDTLNFFYMPAGARIIDVVCMPTDMDTGGPTLTLNIGDAGLQTRFFSALAAGVTSVASHATLGIGFLYTAKTMITAVPQANATTGAAGSVFLAVSYTIED